VMRTPSRASRVRVFYRSEESREAALAALQPILEEMLAVSSEASGRLAADEAGEIALSLEERRAACAAQRWAMGPPEGCKIAEPELIECIGNDVGAAEGGDERIGLEMPERLLWEAYVERQDISHEAGGFGDTGRASSPAFMDLNLQALAEESHPKAVLWQYDGRQPMNARGLLMAHEEDKVRPVASDIDCFLIGSRNVTYTPMAAPQVATMGWMLTQIEHALREPRAGGWMSCWLDALKAAYLRGDEVLQSGAAEVPPFGFGDPTSTELIEALVKALRLTGAVRHGAECFNFLFPQDLDDDYLVCWAGFQAAPAFHQVPWQYVGRQGLLHFLAARVDEGYAFPLNPKWALCDEGWYALFERLLASEPARPACNAWYPPDSGLRERMAEIHAAFPDGFRSIADPHGGPDQSCDAGVAEWELRRYQVLQRAKKKLRAIAVMLRIYRAKKSRRSLKRVVAAHRLSRAATRARLDALAAVEQA
jgi:hypothetical protein